MSNDICVILPCNIYVAPFYFRYEELLAKSGSKFDLIIWNRANIVEKTSADVIYYNLSDISNNNDKAKVFKFFKFAIFTKNVIRKNKYKKLIFLGSYAGNAILFSNFLKNKYKNLYWFDIRDYTYEWFKPYYWLIDKTIKNSYITALSSDGFKRFLPDHDYLLVHNIDKNNISKSILSRKNIIKTDVIRISFIGNIRYYPENIRLINALKNDKRFVLQYFGAGSERLSDYCKHNQITNVKFVGRFNPEDTAKFYAETDIINNVYGNDRIDVITLLSNKLYFSAKLHIPILVSPGTYMSDITTEYGFGYNIDFMNNHIADDIYAWYLDFTKKSIQPRYVELWNKVKLEDELFENTFNKFIST